MSEDNKVQEDQKEKKFFYKLEPGFAQVIYDALGLITTKNVGETTRAQEVRANLTKLEKVEVE